MAVGAIMIFYLVSMVCHFMGINIPMIHEGGLLSIGITLVIIVIASLNLMLDFDNFEKPAIDLLIKFCLTVVKILLLL